jgi:hypothetical protein
MAEKKPVPKIEPVEKRTFKEKIYNFFDDTFGEGYRKRTQEYYCRADLSNLGKSDASFPLGITGYLSPRDAVQLMYSNDPEVRKLQRRTVVTSLRAYKDNDPDDELGWGAAMRKALQEGTDKPFDEVCKKGVPKYIYEPGVRYKRRENPDYKRHGNYSMAGTLTGVGMLATGIASGILPLAYTGAALTLASFGYQSGHWLRKRKTDQSFEKLPLSLSELEKKAQKMKVQKPGNPDSHYLSNHAGSLSDITAKESYKDDALYVRRLYRAEPPTPPVFIGAGELPAIFKLRAFPFLYSDVDMEVKHGITGWTGLGVGLTALCLASAVLVDAKSAVTAAESLLAAGSIGLATLCHQAGYFLGGKDAPEYRKV